MLFPDSGTTFGHIVESVNFIPSSGEVTFLEMGCNNLVRLDVILDENLVVSGETDKRSEWYTSKFLPPFPHLMFNWCNHHAVKHIAAFDTPTFAVTYGAH